jgi:hypothetical protein
MKRAIITLLTIVGALAVVFVLSRLAASTQSYETLVRREFGTPEAIQALTALYERVEKDGAALKQPGAKYCRIPQEWMPSDFAAKWEHYYNDVSQVAATFDDAGRLTSIEFDGSRCGCYISRDSTRCPSHFSSLHRIAERPLFITARVEE